jgi:uncharacterized protein (TIGR03435 family)
MKSKEALDQSLARHSNPPAEQVESAVARVWRNLAPEVQEMPEDSMFGAAENRSKAKLRWPLWVAAALVVLGVVSVGIVRNVIHLSGPTALVETIDGTLYRMHKDTAYAIPVGERITVGETVRTDGGAVLALMDKSSDKSRIEMRSGAEFTLESASDGTRIRLSRGSILIAAAEQAAGHLYVETKDVVVSVVGTVFLVNVEAGGSRVGVIEGKVNVVQSGVEETLGSGGQMSTSSLLELRPVAEDITWSRNAPQYLALLASAQPIPPIPAFQGRTVSEGQFVVSIKRETRPPNGARAEDVSRLSCTGKDGKWGASMPDPVLSISTPEEQVFSLAPAAPRGRCVGRYVGIQALMAAIYDVPLFVITGAIPNWRASGSGFEFGFSIEAVAPDTSDVTTGQLRQMLKAAIIDRFKIKTHPEVRIDDGFALTVAPGGAGKIQRVTDSEETGPYSEESFLQHVIKAKTSMKTFAEYLFRTGKRCTVVDKTGLAGIYDYTLTLQPASLADRFGGKLINGGRPTPEQAVEMEKRLAAIGGLTETGNEPCGARSGIAYNPSFNTALQQQLGLRLERQQVPVEFIVVDEVREPSEN